MFYAPEEALRSQIVELFKSMLDLSQFREVQAKVENVIVDALLKPFYELLKASPKRAVTCEGEGEVNVISVDANFRNQTQLLFELI